MLQLEIVRLRQETTLSEPIHGSHQVSPVRSSPDCGITSISVLREQLLFHTSYKRGEEHVQELGVTIFTAPA